MVYPEKRNHHGKTFGGFVASSAYNLAYFAARCVGSHICHVCFDF